MHVGVTYIVSFEITNPGFASYTAPGYSTINPNFKLVTIPDIKIAASGTARFDLTTMDLLNQVLLGRLCLPCVALLAGEINRFTITIQFNINIAKGSSILISGIKDAKPDDLVPIEPYSMAMMFSYNGVQGYGGYSPDVVTFELYDQPLLAGKTYNFSFTLTNSLFDQTESTVTIAVTGGTPNINFSPLPLERSNLSIGGIYHGANPPLVVRPSFIKRDMYQATPIASVANVLYVKLQVNVPFGGQNASITIRGLSNAIYADIIDLQPIDGSDGIGTVSAVPYFQYDGQVGKGKKSSGEGMILNFVDNSSFVLNVIYSFKFNIFNPSAGQDSPNISISGIGFANYSIIRYRDQIMSPGPRNTAPLLIADFTYAFISQSTPSQISKNQITLLFSTRADLVTYTRITLTGLIGSRTPFAELSITADDVFNPKGLWSPENGEIVINVVKTSEARKVYSIVFEIENENYGQDSPNIYIYTSIFVIAKTSVQKASGNYAPMLIADFLVKTIYQQTVSPLASNEISVILSTRASLIANSTRVTISGLTGLEPVLATQMLYYPTMASSAFGNIAEWEYYSGSLILTVSKDTAPKTNYTLSIKVINPQRAQVSPVVQISSSGILITITEMSRGLGNAAPLLIAGFQNLLVSQSTPSVFAKNTLTFSLKPNCEITAPAQITISALNGIIVTNEYWAVSSANSINPFSTTARWMNGGFLVVSLLQSVLADVWYTFRVDVVNSGVSQDAQSLKIAVTGVVNVTQVNVPQALGNNAPLLIAGFVYKWIGQSTTYKSALNAISVTIAMRMSLDLFSQVVIEGLKDTLQTSTDLLEITVYGDDAPFQQYGSFDQTSGRLTIRMRSPSTANATYILSFYLANPHIFQPSANVTIRTTRIVTTNDTMDYSLGANAPLYVFTPEEASSRCANLQSWQQISLSKFSARRGLAVIVQSPMQILYPSNSTLFDFAAFRKEDANLILYLDGNSRILAGIPYVFSFRFRNLASSQEGQTLYISSSGSATIAPQKMTSDQVTKLPVLGS
eukprot:763692-Hanusia_phi.AAC.1